ncbi:translation initiation factor eIF-5A [Galdieria sulphuraria]|uniref:Eukaryotic translation initiation factor 5A n=1 Tax=Galdieria sulphuraria TaxID=130081 RepID=M2Y544_GALSU|nr:translation initiation factor eIF-5A [Galdieria sulphuraria]EME30974.1 translation initiation factor eIF-5A [Galdieria sulphuraria]|eukprot:XP_005707494.1 translation initiation factor eIF-5A [Galdieria sulphuraria]
MSDDVVTADAGAAEATPIQAGSVKKNSFVVLKGFPCKVVDISTSKTGKHGHAKANIVGVDIFTGKKYEEMCPTSHNILQPVVNRKDYQLVDIEDDGFVVLMDENNETRSDLKLDLESDDVHKKIKQEFNEGKELLVTVLSAMKTEKIIASKELNP